MTEQAILERVQALLNKTVNNGCSVEESATASKLAQKLITKYKLSISDLDSDVSGEPIHNEADPLFCGKRMVSWKTQLATSISNVNGCKIFIRTMKDWNRGCRQNRAELRIIGRDSDIEIVRYFFLYLAAEIERLCKLAMNAGQGTGKTWSNSFKFGAVNAIHERLQEGNKEARAECSNTTAIVKLDARQAEVDQWADTNMNIKQNAKKRINIREDGYYDGDKAGRSIPLSKGIGPGAPKQLR